MDDGPEFGNGGLNVAAEPAAFGLLLLDIWAPCTHRKALNQYVMYVGGVPVLAVFVSVTITSGVNLLGS